jgi:hypothetical protein
MHKTQYSYPKCNPLCHLPTHPAFGECEKNVKSPRITKEGMIKLVGTKLEGHGCSFKSLALVNFICNGLSCHEFPFHFVMSSCLIPTQSETQIILLFDDTIMYLVL